MSKVISVFGSSRVPEGSPDYADSVAVGAGLARAGYTVMTGGYAGVMEAASRGAGEVGGQVIGVTSTQIEAIRSIPANRWVTKVVPHDKMSTRLDYLVRTADAYVVMPGGVGTLNELVLAWEYMRVGELPARPLVCYGEIWQATLGPFMDARYVPEHHQGMVQFAETAEDVVRLVQAGLS